ncbi:hypothetical protein BK809_0007624 [Diplodia seriata]|uniref:Uncharacterized protein n=1 Tax=Diplodia seriata TaxID=420778 RepID=A0A1S8BJ57_9PEZI|nr:hypothetical protein BK809_0007624 [Diplodia seriata]
MRRHTSLPHPAQRAPHAPRPPRRRQRPARPLQAHACRRLRRPHPHPVRAAHGLRLRRRRARPARPAHGRRLGRLFPDRPRPRGGVPLPFPCHHHHLDDVPPPGRRRSCRPSSAAPAASADAVPRGGDGRRRLDGGRETRSAGVPPGAVRRRERGGQGGGTRALRRQNARRDADAAAATPGDDDVPADAWVSTYDALSALVWTRVHAARVRLRRGKKQQQGGKEEEEEDEEDEGEALPSRDFLTSVNYRARLALPARYPFNAVFAPYTRLAHGELMGPDALPVAARTVHGLTRSVGVEEARATARWMAAQPDKRRVKWGFDGGYGSTMISAWNKFDVYEGAAFVEGRPPVLVAPPFTPMSLVDGLAYYLPTEALDGGIDLYLALSVPVWGVLAEDEVWRKFR